jgi:hypothetical protein
VWSSDTTTTVELRVLPLYDDPEPPLEELPDPLSLSSSSSLLLTGVASCRLPPLLLLHPTGVASCRLSFRSFFSSLSSLELESEVERLPKRASAGAEANSRLVARVVDRRCLRVGTRGSS